MLDRVKSFFGRMSRKAKYCAAMMSAAIGTAIMSVVASAEDGTPTNMQTVITDAGSQLKTEFGNLVSTVVPVLIGIAVTGLVIYGVIYLFRMAKKLFSKAAG